MPSREFSVHQRILAGAFTFRWQQLSTSVTAVSFETLHPYKRLHFRKLRFTCIPKYCPCRRFLSSFCTTSFSWMKWNSFVFLTLIFTFDFHDSQCKQLEICPAQALQGQMLQTWCTSLVATIQSRGGAHSTQLAEFVKLTRMARLKPHLARKKKSSPESPILPLSGCCFKHSSAGQNTWVQTTCMHSFK